MEVLHPRCAGLDVPKDSVVAAVRLAEAGGARTEVRRFDTTTPGLLALADWLAECGCTHAAMEATGVYWKPVWHVPSDGDPALILANAAHVKDVPGRTGRPGRGRRSGLTRGSAAGLRRARRGGDRGRRGQGKPDPAWSLNSSARRT